RLRSLRRFHQGENCLSGFFRSLEKCRPKRSRADPSQVGVSKAAVNPLPTESSGDVKFEIGHVLYIDIVGYSKLNIHEQSELLETLKKVVRGTEQVRAAEEEGKLLRLP